MNVKTIVGSAFLLAIALLSQNIRNLIPVHGIFMFFVGTVINACMALAVWRFGWVSGLAIAIITPITAFMQQILTIPLFVPIVALGDVAFVIAAKLLHNQKAWLVGIVAAIVKGGLLYLAFLGLFAVVDFIPEPMQKGVLFSMGWPQLIVALAGVYLARLLERRVPQLRKPVVANKENK